MAQSGPTLQPIQYRPTLEPTIPVIPSPVPEEKKKAKPYDKDQDESEKDRIIDKPDKGPSEVEEKTTPEPDKEPVPPPADNGATTKKKGSVWWWWLVVLGFIALISYKPGRR